MDNFKPRKDRMTEALAAAEIWEEMEREVLWEREREGESERERQREREKDTWKDKV